MAELLRKHRCSPLDRACPDRLLNLKRYLPWWVTRIPPVVPFGSVFFTQHTSKIVRMELWAGHFFIACRNPLVKVSVRQRGEPQVDSPGVFGE